MSTSTANARLLCSALLIASLAGLPGCKNKSGRNAGLGHRVNEALGRGHITLDGETSDWPANVATVADDDWIYFRLTVEGQPAPIQASPESLELWLDVDNSPKTGQMMPAPADAAGMGVDLVVAYSPIDPEKHQTIPGVEIKALDTAGGTISLNPSQIGLGSLPSYGSTQYEARISRHVDETAAPALAKAIASKGRARGMFVLKNGTGAIIGWSDPETFQKPSAAKKPPRAEVTVPSRKPGTVRIVTYNVLKSEIAKNPPPFARIFEVLNADIILCQEWDTDAATATSWFSAVVSGQHPWYARTGPDVVIVSPYEIAPLGPDQVTYEGAENPVRFAAGIVKTPVGDVAVGTTHLKCCGTAGSPEDARRLAEARAINAAMKSAMGNLGTPLRIIGGDLNLVGTPSPLGALAAGLDADGSDLAIAQPVILGDPAMFTWRDPKTPFPPGRLDYILVGDAGVQVIDAFVLDTGVLGQKSLAKMGLDPSDASISDHLPVVIDVKPR